MAPMETDLSRIEAANDMARRMAEALRPHIADMIASAIASAIFAHMKSCRDARAKQRSFKESLFMSVEKCPVAAAIVVSAWILRDVILKGISS